MSCFFQFSFIDTVLIIIFIFFSIYYLFTQNLLVAQEKFGLYNWLDLINRTLSILLLGILVYNFHSPTAGYSALVVSLVLVSVAATINIWLYNYRNGQESSFSFMFNLDILKSGFKFSLITYSALVLYYCFLKINVFFLKQYFSAHELGIWSIALQIFETIIILPATFGFLLYPKLLKSKQAYDLLIPQIKIVAVLILLSFLPIIFLGHFIIITLYGVNYEESYVILLYSLPAIFCMSIITLLSQYISAMGMPWQQAINWSAGILVQIGLIIGMKNHFGLAGIMTSLSISSAVILILMVRLAMRMKRNSQKSDRLAADLKLSEESFP